MSDTRPPAPACVTPSPSASTPTLRCPACNALFRGCGQCSRCGADLLPLMHLAAEAYRLRFACWHALRRGDIACAAKLARAAEEAHATADARRLALLARTLEELTRR